MIKIGIFEAKANLGQLAQAAAAGEVILLTRRGKPIAQIRQPEGEISRECATEAIAKLRAYRRSIRTGPFEIAELVAEGRR